MRRIERTEARLMALNFRIEMNRTLAILTGVAVLGGAGVVTFRQDFYSRYHFDTLREERFTVSKIFGVPIWKVAREPRDEYSEIYREITGRVPDSDRRRTMPADYTRGLVGGVYRCFGPPFPFSERDELLEELYRKYSNGMTKEEALHAFEKIDSVIPPDRVREIDIDFSALDDLREELGLERRYTMAAKQPTTGQARAALSAP